MPFRNVMEATSNAPLNPSAGDLLAMRRLCAGKGAYLGWADFDLRTARMLRQLRSVDSVRRSAQLKSGRQLGLLDYQLRCGRRLPLASPVAFLVANLFRSTLRNGEARRRQLRGN